MCLRCREEKAVPLLGDDMGIGGRSAQDLDWGTDRQDGTWYGDGHVE